MIFKGKSDRLDWRLSTTYAFASLLYFFLYSRGDISAAEVDNTILDVRKWWSALYNESFDGSSKNVGDEFSFRAGGGVHYSK